MSNRLMVPSACMRASCCHAVSLAGLIAKLLFLPPRRHAIVPLTSAVSVFVIDWTTIGWALPTCTPPTLTVTVGRRVLTGRKYSARKALRSF